MELKFEKRDISVKSKLGEIRRAGDIPAVLYVKGKESVPVVIDGAVLQAHLRTIPKGCLATQIFDVAVDGKKKKAIIKDISYHRISYVIEHIDFMVVDPSDLVTVYVPIVCKGGDVCPGLTQGGQFKQLKRSVKVTMPIKEMPEAFTLNVGHLNLGESVRVKDVPLSSGMKMRVHGDQILVTVSK